MQLCTICHGLGVDGQGRVCPYDAVHKAKRPSMHNIQSPRTDDDAIEAEIRAKGLTAPRITPDDIAANIASEHYFTAADAANRPVLAGGFNLPHGLSPEETNPAALGLLTFCVLVLRNGFTVTGESACASPENFNAEVGKKIARANAVNKVWALEGYLLKERLYQSTQPAQNPT